jgi:hypothetical protein
VAPPPLITIGSCAELPIISGLATKRAASAAIFAFFESITMPSVAPTNESATPTSPTA